MVGLLVGLALGLAIGILGFAFVAERQRSQQAQTIQDLQRRLTQAEQDHEQRLRQATEQLRRDYDAQLAQRTAPAAGGSTAAGAIPAAPEPVATPAFTPPPAPAAGVEPPVTPVEPPVTPVASAASVSAPPVPTVAATAALVTPSVATLMAQSYSPDPQQRVAVATAIGGTLAIAPPQQAGQWLPLLGRLSRDPETDVRLATIQALAQVKSGRSLPWLRRALKDTDTEVVAAAHAAISRFKGLTRPAVKRQRSRRLPKNR